MGLLFVFTNAFLIGFSGALMPGPLLTVNISESVRKGFVAGPIVVAGHAIAELGVLLVIYLGLTKLLADPGVFFWIAVIGGFFLILMGGSMLWQVLTRRVRLELTAGAPQQKGKTLALAAIVSIASPYWILWWLTVGALLITQSLAFGLVGLAVFYVGHILSDLVWYSLVSALIARGKRYFNDLIYRILIFVCGLFLALLGVYFINSARTGAFLEQLRSAAG
jgi:threonine/homoserine/homoserine lactone efflux protein